MNALTVIAIAVLCGLPLVALCIALMRIGSMTDKEIAEQLRKDGVVIGSRNKRGNKR
jgi:hypothetical protein